MYMNLGTSISLDAAFDNGMHDVFELTLYGSREDDEGYRHLILLTIWQKGDLVAHNFAYAVDSEDGLETRESAGEPHCLIDDLPEPSQERARQCVEQWCSVFLAEEREVRS